MHKVLIKDPAYHVPEVLICSGKDTTFGTIDAIRVTIEYVCDGQSVICL